MALPSHLDSLSTRDKLEPIITFYHLALHPTWTLSGVLFSWAKRRRKEDINLGVLKFWSSFEICLFVSFFMYTSKNWLFLLGHLLLPLYPVLSGKAIQKSFCKYECVFLVFDIRPKSTSSFSFKFLPQLKWVWAGFHMTSLNFKLQNYWSSWNVNFMMNKSS